MRWNRCEIRAVPRAIRQSFVGDFYDLGAIGATVCVEQVDFGTRVVDDNEVIETVSVKVGGAQETQFGYRWENSGR